MAKADAKTAKGGKQGAKADKGKKNKGGSPDGPVMSVARHPTAGPQVRRMKGLGGLLGFCIAAALSYQANVPPLQIGLRALAVGVAGYLVAWGCSVTVWRVLLTAQLKALYEELHPPQVAPSVATEASVPSPAAEPGAS
jgi:hypothetical protein